MRRTVAVWLLCVVTLHGCAGNGQIVTLDLRAQPPAEDRNATPSTGALRALVLPFEDQRAEKGWLGTRTHLWGGETHFDVPGGKPGEAVAKALADFLRERGWHVALGAASGSPLNFQPDVTFKGEVLELIANAKSRFGSTKMAVRVSLALHVLNAADRSLARLTVNGARTDSEMWFEPDVLAGLLNEALYESFAQLVAETKVEGRTLQIR